MYCFELSRNSTSADILRDINTYLRKQIEEDLQEHSVKFAKMGVQSLMNSLKKDSVK